MSGRYISEFEPGMLVDRTFALTSKEMRAARTGEAYLVLELSDRTGRIPAIAFRPSREAEAIPVGVVVHVRGTVTEYRGARRVSVASIKAAGEYDLRDIVRAGTRDAGEMLTELRKHARVVREPGLKALLRAVFGDATFMRRFTASPATASGHHAHIGGLLEHTVAVAATCARIALSHPQIDHDLLMTAALLHDTGVVDALQIGTGITPTDEGRLIGHEVLGDRRVASACDRLSVTPSRAALLRLSHIILSHHVADGAAGLAPSTVEAIVLQHADRADADASVVLDLGARASVVGELWTDGPNPYGRSLAAPMFPSAAPGEQDSPALSA